MEIIEQFKILIDPSGALGAFLISLSASIIVSFFFGRATVYQKAKNVGGDMIQNSNVSKR